MQRAHLSRWTALILAVACAAAAPAASADTLYAWVKGARQGVLKGEVIAKGREGATIVTRLQQELVVPHDAAGRVSGRRQYHPFVISHANNSPMAVQLLNAAVTNEVLSEVIVQIWGNPGSVARGDTGPVLLTTIKLTNATVLGASTVAAPATPGAEPSVQQEVTLGFQRIEVTDNRGNVVMSDDVSASAAN
jgi:type VI secretion system secreted protein Hcp